MSQLEYGRYLASAYQRRLTIALSPVKMKELRRSDGILVGETLSAAVLVTLQQQSADSRSLQYRKEQGSTYS